MQGRDINTIQPTSRDGHPKGGGLFPKVTLTPPLWHDLHRCHNWVRTLGLSVNPYQSPLLSRWPIQIKFMFSRETVTEKE